MERIQVVGIKRDFTPRDFLSHVAVGSYSPSYQLKAVRDGLEFCNLARIESIKDVSHSMLERGDFRMTKSGIDEEAGRFFCSRMWTKFFSFNHFDEEKKKEILGEKFVEEDDNISLDRKFSRYVGIFSQVVDEVGSDYSRWRDFETILKGNKGLDKEGVNLFSDSRRMNLVGLGTKKSTKKQFAGMVGEVYRNREADRKTVLTACADLQWKYEKRPSDFFDICEGGMDVCYLTGLFERWAKPFGLVWRRERINYISRVVRAGEWREENGVK